MSAFAASIFVFLALATGSWAVLSRRRPGRLDERRLRGLHAAPARQDARTPSLRRSRSSIPALRSWLDTSSWAQTTQGRLRRAGSRLRPGEFFLLRLLLAVLLFGLAFAAGRASVAGLLVALVAGLVGYLAPRFYLSWAIQRRHAAIEGQLADLVSLLSSSLRAGFSIYQALEVAAQQIGGPLAEELAAVLADVRLGGSLDAALVELGQRIGGTDLDVVITAILVQRTTGGGLAEVLDQAGRTISERERVRGDIMTLTTQQRLTGYILGVYPIGVGLLLLAMMPALWMKLFTEPLGQVMVAIALSLQVLGFLLMRRALRVDF